MQEIIKQYLYNYMQTHVHNLERSLQKTMDLLRRIEEKNDWKNNHEISYKALIGTLHTLRDRLEFHEAVHFGSQLPLIIRGVFYEGFKANKHQQKMNKEEFLQKIQSEALISQENSEQMVKNVIEAIGEFMSPGSIDKVKNTLPGDYGDLF